MVGPDLRDPPVLRSAVAQQHEPVCAGIGAVEHAEAVGRRSHVEDRPDLAVHDREWRESFHHLRVGLVDEPAGQPPVFVDVEVAVLNQQRHLERRPFRQPEVALPVVTHDPESREPGVDVELGDAHDVVVVPEQRRPLVHRVAAERGLTRGEEVLGPAVLRGGCETAVQVDDRVPGQSGRVFVRRTTAQARKALYGHTVGVDRLRGDSDGDGEGPLQLVAPFDRDRLPAFGLDRGAWNRPLEAPDARRGKVAVEAVFAGANAYGQPAVMLQCEP